MGAASKPGRANQLSNGVTDKRRFLFLQLKLVFTWPRSLSIRCCVPMHYFASSPFWVYFTKTDLPQCTTGHVSSASSFPLLLLRWRPHLPLPHDSQPASQPPRLLAPALLSYSHQIFRNPSFLLLPPPPPSISLQLLRPPVYLSVLQRVV